MNNPFSNSIITKAQEFGNEISSYIDRIRDSIDNLWRRMEEVENRIAVLEKHHGLPVKLGSPPPAPEDPTWPSEKQKARQSAGRLGVGDPSITAGAVDCGHPYPD